jgi:hypothetical protein
MESVVSLRDSFGDAFVTLPLLLLGFIFLFGTLTSNTGLLLLFIGQAVLVPILGFFANYDGSPFATPGIAASTVAASIIFYAVHSGAISSIAGNNGWGFLSTPAFIWIAQWLIRRNYGNDPLSNRSHFDIINPAKWFGVQSINPSTSENCSIIPNEKNSNKRPTDWVNHILFFFGFLISNAVAVYSEPTPKVTDAGTEQEIKERQARVDARVANRKFLTACIIAVSVVVLALLLAFRYNKSGCEETIYLAFVPLLIAGFTGAAWFNIIYKSCGVRPTDILGIVQGMVPAELVDNPIVCVGS